MQPPCLVLFKKQDFKRYPEDNEWWKLEEGVQLEIMDQGNIISGKALGFYSSKCEKSLEDFDQDVDII